ncbi:MAG: hypothetical protein QXV62_03060 [Nitrososphaerota archaeon]
MIVRGFIVPKRGPDDKPAYTRIISDEEGEMFYEHYKQIIKYLLDEFVENNGERRPLQDADDVNAFLNFLVLFLRSALYVDTIPSVVPATAGQTHRYFLHQYLNKIKEGLEPDTYFEWLGRSAHRLAEEEELRNEIREFFDFPADSRPGANTSSLLVHMLTVSGIASCMYLGMGNRGFRLAVLRLTCLFHDLGKFVNWRRHEEISARVLEDLVRDYVRGEAEKVVEEAAALIPRAKATDPLKELYVRADSVASGIDRLSTHFLKVLSDNTREMVIQKAQDYLGGQSVDDETFIEKCYNEWGFWNKLSLEEKRGLTEDFCRRAGRVSKDNPLLARLNDAMNTLDGLKDIEIVRFDVRRIQEYIKVNDLRTMAGGSLVVDFVISVALPLALMLKAGLPAETILQFGGGNVFVLLPSSSAHKVMEMAGKMVRESCGLSLATASHEFLASYAETSRRIEAEVIKMKLSEEDHVAQLDEKQPYLLNIFALCEVCGHKPPTKQEDGKLYCDLCLDRREKIGDRFHFMYKLSRLGYGLEEMPRYLKYMIEYIAGSSEDEVRAGRFKEYKNVAVLRIDANVVGAFMGSSISLTDAFERSIRIDYSLKKAYNTFLNMLKEINPEMYDRMVLGTIYMGGDDAFLLAPSRMAPYLAALLMNEFYLEMGSRLTLSCGIAVAKPKHPLTPLYEAAGYLLDSVKKSVRQKAYSIYELPNFEEERGGEFEGALAFYTIDGGYMTPENLEEVLKRLYRMGVSRQYREPYTISGLSSVDGKRSFLRLLQLISSALHAGEGNGWSLDGLRGLIERDVRLLLTRNESSERIKDLIATMKRDISIELLGDKSTRLQVIFARRQAERLEDKRGLISNLLQMLEFDGDGLRLGVADALLLAKVVLGE